MSLSKHAFMFTTGLGFFLATPPSLADEPLPNGLTNSSSVRFGDPLDPASLRLLPLYAREEKGGPTRSFETLALLLPGTQNDRYGVSFLGISSPENSYFIDGIRVGNPVLGVSALPLSAEFAEKVDISLIGSDATFGRGSGGVYDVNTRSGTNEWRTSIWGSMTPGGLDGARALVPSSSTIQTQSHLAFVSDFGAATSGPLIKNKLFFFAGGSFALRRYELDRSLHRVELQSDGTPEIDPKTELQRTTLLPGSITTAIAAGQIGQWTGTLSYRPSSTTEFSIATLGNATSSGGDGTYTFDNMDERLDKTNLNGNDSALGGTNSVFTHALILRGASSFAGGKARVDSALGWVHGTVESAAADGSGVDDIDTPGTLAHVPGVLWRRNSTTTGRHWLGDFETLSADALGRCNPNGVPGEENLHCPVSAYRTGGPGFLSKQTTNRVQGRAVLSVRAQALGEHRLRAGIDFEVETAAYKRGFSGRVYIEENLSGRLVVQEQFGYLRGPDDPVALASLTTSGSSISGGVFVADTWQIRKNLVAEASLRYDGQMLRGEEPTQSIALPFMFSPRVGFSWDPMNNGRSRFFGSYMLRYQHVPLNVALRGLSAENRLTFYQQTSSCDIGQPTTLYGGCGASLIANDSSSPTQRYVLNGGSLAVDSALQAPAAHQVVVGAEATLPWQVRLGITAYSDDLLRALEDATTIHRDRIIGNPGYGRTVETPEATRTSSGLSLTVMRPFAKGFVGLASYTLSHVHGNYEGYFRSDTGQLDPNQLSSYDTPEHNENNTHDLPNDHRHALKLYAGKEFVLPVGVNIEVGGGYTTRSGLPYYAHADNPNFDYGSDVFLPLPGGRKPWLHRLDARLGVSAKLRKNLRLGASVDIFNVANSQAAIAVDQNYTYDWVYPQTYGKPGQPEPTPNPNYGKPTEYQSQRQVRFGLRLDY